LQRIIDQFADDHHARTASAFGAAFLGADGALVFAQVLENGAVDWQTFDALDGIAEIEVKGAMSHGAADQTEVLTKNHRVRRKSMALLSTHVLDTAHGKPAGLMRFELYAIAADNERTLVASGRTNADGRTDQSLLWGDTIPTLRYELVFHAGDYFRALGIALPDPAFVDVVQLNFGIAEATGDYHVPLLVSPWAYSTYRGS
jgi:5-hydroxyisourate hydrolase